MNFYSLTIKSGTQQCQVPFVFLLASIFIFVTFQPLDHTVKFFITRKMYRRKLATNKPPIFFFFVYICSLPLLILWIGSFKVSSCVFIHIYYTYVSGGMWCFPTQSIVYWFNQNTHIHLLNHSSSLCGKYIQNYFFWNVHHHLLSLYFE